MALLCSLEGREYCVGASGLHALDGEKVASPYPLGSLSMSYQASVAVYCSRGTSFTALKLTSRTGSGCDHARVVAAAKLARASCIACTLGWICNSNSQLGAKVPNYPRQCKLISRSLKPTENGNSRDATGFPRPPMPSNLGF